MHYHHSEAGITYFIFTGASSGPGWLKHGQTLKWPAWAIVLPYMNSRLLSRLNISRSMRPAGRLIDLYSTVVVPQANLAVESVLSGYQVGSVDFLTVISDFKTLPDYELRYHRQVAVYHQGLARLEASTGVSLLR